MKKRVVLNVLLVLFILLFAFSLYQIIRITSGYKKAQDEYGSVIEQAISSPADPDSGDEEGESPADDSGQAPPALHVDYQVLKDLNSDYVGWLEIPGTAINYPMVYYTDNDFYLRRTFLGNYSIAGSIFLDARTGSDFSADHIIIYGHRMNDGTMFATLKDFFDPAFYAENKEIRIYTESEILIYEIFAVREVSVDDSCYTFSFSSDKTYQNWLSEMKSKSVVETALQPSNDRSTITLSTCVLNKSTSRNIVQAQLVERQSISEKTS